MSKLTTTRHDFCQDAVLDFFICGGRHRPMQDSEPQQERIPLAEHPHDTKRLRQAMDVATRLSMKHHGWKQTGEKNSLWTFEHRWPHLRDRAEGRNHRLPSK